jgi:hypothetical protein
MDGNVSSEKFSAWVVTEQYEYYVSSLLFLIKARAAFIARRASSGLATSSKLSQDYFYSINI